MAQMPKGQPRTSPDPAGELYDREIAKERARRHVETRSGLDRFQVRRPTFGESMIPVVGPAWEAVADYQDGDYAGATLNGAMAVAEVLPVGVAARGLRMASRGIGVLKNGSISANAAGKQMRARGVVPPGYEVHHTLRLNGLSRTSQDPRNHFALLKPLPKANHRRLTGSWQGQPKYGPVGQIWHGTNDWQKIVPTALGVYGVDAVENIAGPQSARSAPPKR